MTDKKKYLIQIKPMAPEFNALIKTHKAEKPITPVINNNKNTNL